MSREEEDGILNNAADDEDLEDLDAPELRADEG